MKRRPIIARATWIGAVLFVFPVAVSAQDIAAHLGSFKTESESRAAWSRMKAQHETMLGSRDARFVETEVPGRGVWFRVLIPVSDRNDANRLCQSLKSVNQYCVPMAGALGASRPASTTAASPPAREVTPRARPDVSPQPSPSPPPQQTAARPAAVPANPPQRTATQAPEPIAAQPPPPPPPPVEPPAANAAAPYFGVWARKAPDCNARDVRIGATQLIYRDLDGSYAMACKIEFASAQLSISCEDDSHALFDVQGRDEMTLRWTKGTRDGAPVSSGAVWRRCVEARR